MGFLRKIPTLVWFLIPTLLILGVGVWALSSGVLESKEDPTKPATVSSEIPGTETFSIVGRDHINQGTPGSGYNSNPPSSGPHWLSPSDNGYFENEFPDEQLLHNLEHGHIWIAFKADIGDDVKTKIKEITEKEDWKVVAAPRSKNDSKIALVAWGRVLKMEEPDYKKIEDFIRTYRNRGPENTPE